jgi:hypothetical protein
MYLVSNGLDNDAGPMRFPPLGGCNFIKLRKIFFPSPSLQPAVERVDQCSAVGVSQRAMHLRQCVSGTGARIVDSPPKESFGPVVALLDHPLLQAKKRA